MQRTTISLVNEAETITIAQEDIHERFQHLLNKEQPVINEQHCNGSARDGYNDSYSLNGEYTLEKIRQIITSPAEKFYVFEHDRATHYLFETLFHIETSETIETIENIPDCQILENVTQRRGENGLIYQLREDVALRGHVIIPWGTQSIDCGNARNIVGYIGVARNEDDINMALTSGQKIVRTIIGTGVGLYLLSRM